MLKVDYKDDIFPGARLYQMVKNDDGTYSFTDVTEYTQEGDLFGANDINATNSAVNALMDSQILNVPVSGWSDTYPYSQIILADEIADTDAPVIACCLTDGPTADQVKAQTKAFGLLYRAVSGSGSITFYAYKKPEVDFQVTLKGV